METMWVNKFYNVWIVMEIGIYCQICRLYYGTYVTIMSNFKSIKVI